MIQLTYTRPWVQSLASHTHTKVIIQWIQWDGNHLEKRRTAGSMTHAKFYNTLMDFNTLLLVMLFFPLNIKVWKESSEKSCLWTKKVFLIIIQHLTPIKIHTFNYTYVHTDNYICKAKTSKQRTNVLNTIHICNLQNEGKFFWEFLETSKKKSSNLNFQHKHELQIWVQELKWYWTWKDSQFNH